MAQRTDDVGNDRECTVLFDAYTKVMPGASTYNIVGEIPGENPDRMILLSGHYDSYFRAFRMTTLLSAC